MAILSLTELVQALSNAVIEAQNLVENQQVALLSRFFDDRTHAPACLPVVLPRMGLNNPGEAGTTLQVPLLSLVEPSMLHITEFQVSFDVELGGLGEGDDLDHAPDRPATPAGVPPAQPVPPTPGASPEGVPAPAAAPARTSRLMFWRRASRTPAAFDLPVVFPDVGGARPAAADESGPRAAPVAARAPSSEVGTGPPAPAMMVGLGPKGASVQMARATLKVSCRPTSDGMVRLLNHLNKTF